MDDSVLDELLRQLRYLRREVDRLKGECYQVTLCNTKPWPENDSRKYISLAKIRDDNNYQVTVEVESAQNGEAGDIIISQKLRNGFALAYTGTASQITLNIWVQDRPARKEQN